MTRRLAFFAPIALFCTLLFGVGSAHAAVPSQLTAPASNSVQTGGVVQVSYALSEIPDLNSAHLTFTPAVGISYQYGMYFGATSDDFTFPVSLPSTAPEFYSGGGVPLPDGVYTVILDYTSGGGATPHTLTNTNVRVKNSTTPPNLTSPANSSAGTDFDISYSLPDALNPGSTRLRFTEVDGPVRCTLTLSDLAAATVRTFTINPSNPTGAAEVVSASPSCTLPDAVYEIQLSYADSYANPVAADYADFITLDTATTAPTLTSPVSSADMRGNLAIGYSLGEAGLAGSVKLEFVGPSTSTLTLTNSATGAQSFTLDPAALASAPAVASVTGAADLSSGLYSVKVLYQDALGNPVASSAVATNVQVGPAPVVAPPAGGGSTTTPPPPQICFTGKPPKKWSSSGKQKGKKFKVTVYLNLVRSSRAVEIYVKRSGAKVKIPVTVNGKRLTTITGKRLRKTIDATNGAFQIEVKFKHDDDTTSKKFKLHTSTC